MSTNTNTPGEAVQVFEADGTGFRLSDRFKQMLSQSGCPLFLVFVGQAGQGKSTLANQLWHGKQEGKDLDEYDNPFGVGDGAAHVTEGLYCAPPIKLWQLLQRHGLPLNSDSHLTGAEDVFIVDTEGLQSADGTSSGLLQQVIIMLYNAACCLYVSRSRPTNTDIDPLVHIIKLCNMDYLQDKTSATSHLMMSLLLKDLFSVKAPQQSPEQSPDEATKEAKEQAFTRQKEQKQTLMEIFSNQGLGGTKEQSSTRICAEVFPQYGQVDNPKFASVAAPVYWGSFQSMLTLFCAHANCVQWPSGPQVVASMEKVQNLLQKIRTDLKVTEFAVLRWVLCSHKLGELVKKKLASHCKNIAQKESKDLKEIIAKLGGGKNPPAVDVLIKQVSDILSELDPVFMQEYQQAWPDKWKFEAQLYAEPIWKLLDNREAEFNWWMIAAAVLGGAAGAAVCLVYPPAGAAVATKAVVAVGGGVAGAGGLSLAGYYINKAVKENEREKIIQTLPPPKAANKSPTPNSS